MTLTIGINGFGRIGRNVLRAILESERTDIQVVAINDLAPVETNAHLLEFDSVHGRLKTAVRWTDNSIDAGRGPIQVTALKDPAELPWDGVDIALECTGIFRQKDQAALHLGNGSKKVLISAPAKGEGKESVKTIVYGVNHSQLTANDQVVSNASCTTNCLAPIADILHRAFGIKRAMMTTVHSYTGDQPTHDRAHSDLYRARAAALSMIPTSTGAAQAVGLVLPELKGRIIGTAIRVPTPNVSCIDLTFEAARPVTKEQVNAAMHDAAKGGFKGIVDVSDRKLVSSDFNHNPHSAIFATDQTDVLDGTMVRVLAWYDNEWGFCNRMLDTATRMGQLI